MRTFGQTMRNCLPAIGLGLITAFGVASVTVVNAPSAMAQSGPKSSKEFAETFNAANAAYSARRYSEALQKLDQAAPHAKTNQEKSAIEQVRVGIYCTQNNHAQCITAIEKARSIGGLSGAVNKNYDGLLYAAYNGSGQTAKATAQLKANVAKYGGSADELSVLAKAELAAKNYAEAIKLAKQAISKSGSKPVPYNILLNAYDSQGNKAEFYNTLEKAAIAFKTATYWKPFIERAKSEPSFRSGTAGLDVYRALDAAGVKLTDADKFDWGKQALSLGLSVEAEKIWAPLFKSGVYGGASDKSKDANLRSYATAQAEAKKDREGGLKADEGVAAQAPSGVQYALVGEAYLGSGDFAKAIDMFQKSLTTGKMDAGVTDLVKLRLGIAQFRGGKKADATKTWTAIKADNGAAWLARSWMAIAK